MKKRNRITNIFAIFGIILLQLAVALAISALVFMLFPQISFFSQRTPWLFLLISGVTISIGIFFTGWLAVRLKWVRESPRFPLRAIGTMLGAAIPLVILAVFFDSTDPGSPAYAFSLLLSALGFHLPGFIKQ